jgi:hypothetical protein
MRAPGQERPVAGCLQTGSSLRTTDIPWNGEWGEDCFKSCAAWVAGHGTKHPFTLLADGIAISRQADVDPTHE